MFVMSRIQRNGKIYTISTGISQDFIIKDENLNMQAQEIAKKLDSKGPLNIQCKIVDNKIIPFEINPRLSGTTFIRALAGYNEPEAYILKYLFHEEPDMKNYREILVLRSLKEIILK